MHLTPAQRFSLRSRILLDLEQGEKSVDIDSRFIKPLFYDTPSMQRWAKEWNLEVHTYTVPLSTPRNQPVEWVSFTRPFEPVQLLFTEDDSQL